MSEEEKNVNDESCENEVEGIGSEIKKILEDEKKRYKTSKDKTISEPQARRSYFGRYRKVSTSEKIREYNGVWNFFHPPISENLTKRLGGRRGRGRGRRRGRRYLGPTKDDFRKPGIGSQFEYIKEKEIMDWSSMEEDEKIRYDREIIDQSNLFSEIFSPTILLHEPSSGMKEIYENYRKVRFLPLDQSEKMVEKCEDIENFLLERKKLMLSKVEEYLDYQRNLFLNKVKKKYVEHRNILKKVDEEHFSKKIELQKLKLKLHEEKESEDESQQKGNDLTSLIFQCVDVFNIIFDFLPTLDLLLGFSLSCSYFYYLVRKTPLRITLNCDAMERIQFGTFMRGYQVKDLSLVEFFLDAGSSKRRKKRGRFRRFRSSDSILICSSLEDLKSKSTVISNNKSNLKHLNVSMNIQLPRKKYTTDTQFDEKYLPPNLRLFREDGDPYPINYQNLSYETVRRIERSRSLMLDRTDPKIIRTNFLDRINECLRLETLETHLLPHSIKDLRYLKILKFELFEILEQNPSGYRRYEDSFGSQLFYQSLFLDHMKTLTEYFRSEERPCMKEIYLCRPRPGFFGGKVVFTQPVKKKLELLYDSISKSCATGSGKRRKKDQKLDILQIVMLFGFECFSDEFLRFLHEKVLKVALCYHGISAQRLRFRSRLLDDGRNNNNNNNNDDDNIVDMDDYMDDGEDFFNFPGLTPIINNNQEELMEEKEGTTEDVVGMSVLEGGTNVNSDLVLKNRNRRRVKKHKKDLLVDDLKPLDFWIHKLEYLGQLLKDREALFCESERKKKYSFLILFGKGFMIDNNNNNNNNNNGFGRGRYYDKRNMKSFVDGLDGQFFQRILEVLPNVYLNGLVLDTRDYYRQRNGSPTIACFNRLLSKYKQKKEKSGVQTDDDNNRRTRIATKFEPFIVTAHGLKIDFNFSSVFRSSLTYGGDHNNNNNMTQQPPGNEEEEEDEESKLILKEEEVFKKESLSILFSSPHLKSLDFFFTYRNHGNKNMIRDYPSMLLESFFSSGCTSRLETLSVTIDLFHYDDDRVRRGESKSPSSMPSLTGPSTEDTETEETKEEEKKGEVETEGEIVEEKPKKEEEEGEKIKKKEEVGEDRFYENIDRMVCQSWYPLFKKVVYMNHANFENNTIDLQQHLKKFRINIVIYINTENELDGDRIHPRLENILRLEQLTKEKIKKMIEEDFLINDIEEDDPKRNKLFVFFKELWKVFIFRVSFNKHIITKLRYSSTDGSQIPIITVKDFKWKKEGEDNKSEDTSGDTKKTEEKKEVQ